LVRKFGSAHDWGRLMATPTTTDSLVAKRIGALSVPNAMQNSGRGLLLLAVALITAFGIAFAVGSATATNQATHIQLAPAARSANSSVKILAVGTVPATPALKTPPKRHVAVRRSTPRSAPAVVTPISRPVATTPAVTPVVVPRATVPSVPVTPVPTGGGSSGSSGSGKSKTSNPGTGTSSGGDSGSGGGTGTVSGGG
jgi:uncharacterized membrane protein YgcG